MILFGHPIRLGFRLAPISPPSAEADREVWEFFRNDKRRHDWLLDWVDRFPLRSALPDIPPALNWRWHVERRYRRGGAWHA